MNKDIREKLSQIELWGYANEDGEPVFLSDDDIDKIMELIDPFDYVEPCEVNCTDVRHAYHQGQWDMATRMTTTKHNTSKE